MVGDAHGVQRAVQLAFPIVEKAFQLREVRRKIVFLPDIELEQARVVRKMVVDFGRGQALAFHLQAEFPADRSDHMRLLDLRHQASRRSDMCLWPLSAGIGRFASSNRHRASTI